jgi:5'-methylthioinosine phosphorylase
VFQGPRLESAAEVEKARRDGCDMAGMTSLPEAALARELGLDYAGIAVISNWGAGVRGGLISEADIAETLKEPMARVRALLDALIIKMAEQE